MCMMNVYVKSHPADIKGLYFPDPCPLATQQITFFLQGTDSHTLELYPLLVLLSLRSPTQKNKSKDIK